MILKLSENGRKIVALAIFLMVLIFVPYSLQAKVVKYKGKTFDVAEPGDFIPNQIVVIDRYMLNKKEIYDLAYELGAQVLHENPVMKMFLFEFLDEKSTERALKFIKKTKGNAIVAFRNWKSSIPHPPIKEEKKSQSLESTPTEIKHSTNDPAMKSQWWLWKIKEPYAGTPFPVVKNIAVIDTGVDYNHSDLAGKVVKVFDYVDWDYDPMDEHGHGTHCAGIAAAITNNNIGIHGVSPESIIYAYRVFDRNGSGGTYQIMTAITDAADNPDVHILSCSFGGYFVYGSPEYLAYEAVIDYARITKGKIVCVAAGNEYNNYLYYYQYVGTNYVPCPAYFPNAFTVGATQHEDRRAEFSNSDVNSLNSGDGMETYSWNFVKIVAPGVYILSTLPGDKYDAWDGTSMATPMVAGACARVWGKYSGLTAAGVETRLVNNGQTLNKFFGFHRYEKRLDLMRSMGYSYTGLQGRIINGETAFPLKGAKVEVMVGATVVTTRWTNSAGFFTATGLIYSTNYKLRISTTGYRQREIYVGAPQIPGKIRDLKYPIFLIPSRPTTASDENWRIIAYWNSTVPGLEDYNYGSYYGYSATYWPYEWYESAGMEANAYLQAPSGPVYYWDNEGSLGVSPYVRYTYDSYFGMPLECHVIQDQEVGEYKYWIVCEDSDWCWGQMNFGDGKYPSMPVVEVYKGNTLIQTIKCSDATRDGTGTLYWNVFTLNGDTLTVINMITDTPIGP